MKFVSFLIFSFFLTTMSGQKDMSIDIVGSFDYSGASNYDFISGINLNSISIKSSKTSIINTNRFGVNFSFRIYENMMFKTGIRLAELGSKFNAEYSHTSQCYVPGELVREREFLQYEEEFSNNFIEIPLILRYEYSKKRLSPYFEVGISPHFYMNSKRSYRTVNNNGFSYNIDEVTTGFSKLQLVFVFSAGMNYNISQSLTAFAQPTIRRHLNSIQINPDGTKARFYSMGLEYGVRYRFGNYYNSLKS